MSKIHVFQRHCNSSKSSMHKNRPEWFDRKYTFMQFLESMQNSDKVESFAILHDSIPGPIDDHFLNTCDVDDMIISIKGGSDAGSFLAMIDIVLERHDKGLISDDDILYFVEDDYLHRDGWIDILLEGMELLPNTYLTLYDHPDKYSSMYSQLTSQILCTNSCHWRTTPSTTSTFACRLRTLKRKLDIHLRHCKDSQYRGVGAITDHQRFIDLWQSGETLISCIPGYSAHVETGMLSPTIEWSSI